VEVDVMMSDAEQTPKRRWRGVTVVASAVLVLSIGGGAFAVGRQVADRDARATATSSQTDQTGRTGGHGPMMGSSQADRGDWSWMREHVDDVPWMRHHAGQWQWMQEHPGMRTWNGADGQYGKQGDRSWCW
jgi:hypothetical protein